MILDLLAFENFLNIKCAHYQGTRESQELFAAISKNKQVKVLIKFEYLVLLLCLKFKLQFQNVQKSSQKRMLQFLNIALSLNIPNS